jgi:hypothetical protein
MGHNYEDFRGFAHAWADRGGLAELAGGLVHFQSDRETERLSC